MRTYLKNKRVLGVLIGALVIIGLVGITPRIAHADNPQEAPKFWGYAYDINGKLKTDGYVWATNVDDPSEVYGPAAINPDGSYELYMCLGCQYKRFYLAYAPNATSGTGPVSPPKNVDIHPDQW